MSPSPGFPVVDFLAEGVARWTFATSDRQEQDAEFDHWCGWFGFDEETRPFDVQGPVWLVRTYEV
jgi:hypothetical protein